MLRRIFITGVLLFSPTLMAQVLASVGDHKIELQDFKKKYEDVKASTINPPTAQQYLEDLIRFEIGVQEAEKLKLQNDPVVKDRIRQELYKGVVEKALGSRVEAIKVNEPELANYYKTNPEVRTSHILIEYKPGSTEAEVAVAKKRAEEIYGEVKKSKRPFEELVKLYSDDTLSKNTGGDIGYQSRVTVVPPYYEAAIKLKVGEMSPLVRTRYGFHIIKNTGRRSFAEANKRQIRAAVFDQKRAQVFKDYFDKLKGSYKISVNKSALETVK